MNFGEFKGLVAEYLKTDAQPFTRVLPTPDSEFAGAVALAIREFCAYTFCLFDDNVSVTLPASRELPLRGTAPAKPILWPVSVRINGDELRNFEDAVGPVSLADIQRSRQTIAGVPERWAFRMPDLVLFEKPVLVGSITSCSIAGAVAHPAVTADGNALAIPEEWQRAAVMFTAAKIIDPHAGGTSLDKMMSLDKKAATAMVFLARTAAMHWPGMAAPVLMEVHE